MKLMARPYLFLLLTALGGLSSSATAWELVEDRLFLNTYGTLGLAKLDDDNVEIENQRGQTIDDEVGGNFDNRVGLQLDYRIDSRWGLTWQGLAFKDEDGGYQLETKWAYIQYDATAWLNVRLGRFITPFYQISEQRYVGYSQPWVRPPLEVYGTENDFDYSDGIWLTWTLPTTSVTTTLDVFVSQHKEKTSNVSLELAPIHGAVLGLAKGNVTMRMMVARLPIELEGSNSTLTTLEMLLQQPSAEHDYRFDADFTFYNLGIQYNDLRWLGLFEYVQNRVNSHLYPETESFALTVGHYVGEYLPYLVYAKRSALNTEPETGLMGAANAIANTLIDRRKTDQSSLSVGLRWDVLPGVAIKGQWDHIRASPGNRGIFETEPDSHINLMTVLVDWAF